MTLLSVGSATLAGGHAQWIELRPGQRAGTVLRERRRPASRPRPDHDHAILLRHTIDD